MKKQNSQSVFQWFWRSFLRTALISLVAVELLFIVIYFSTNSLARQQLIDYLHQSANTEMNLLVEKETSIIEKQLQDISYSTETYARQAQEALSQNPNLSNEDLDRLSYSDSGIYYTSHDKENGGAAVFYSGYFPVNEAERLKTEKLLTLQGLMRDLVDAHPLASQIYINTWDSLNVIYPYFEVLDQYAEKMNIPEYNFYYEADAAHNPERQVVWTDAYLDPAGQGWMASAIAPVYSGDFLEGVVGIDVTIDTISKQILDLKFPWQGYGLLVGKDGTILALPDQGQADWGLTELTDHHYVDAIREDTFKPEDFNVYKRPEFSGVSSQLQESANGYAQINLNGNSRLIAWNTVSEAGWKLLVIVPEANIYQPINELATLMIQIGLFMIAGLIFFYLIFFFVLSSRSHAMSQNISTSLNTINTLLIDIGKGDYQQEEPEMPVVELTETAHQLVQMGQKLGNANHELLVTQSELKQSETELKKNEQDLKALVNAIDDVIIQIDEKGLINRIWSNQDSVVPEFFQNQNIGEADLICSILSQSQRQECREKISRVIETGEPQTMEYSLNTSMGKRFYQGRLSKVADTKNTLVVSARDITDRIFMEMSLKTAKEEADLANKAKSDFLSNMSHELRTPLNAILGFSQLMEMNPAEPLSDNQAQYIKEIIHAGDHLLTLINEILDLSAIESGRYSLSIEPVEIIGLTDEVIALMKPLADKKAINLSFEHENLLSLTTLTDQTRLKQILINLVSNAVKYNYEEGSVTVRIEKNGTLIIFHVEDTGFGIPEDQQENIFTPFQRLPEFANRIEGTGIGLAVVKKLCHLINAQIHLESQVGKGSHFWVELAYNQPDDYSNLNQVNVSKLLNDQNYQFLYVEDNLVNLRLLESATSKIPKLTLITAETGETGLELAKLQKPDLIILDIHLPDLDGYQVLKRLKENHDTKDIPVVALSASAMKEDVEKALLMGFEEYFTKPVNMQLFFSKILALLAKIQKKSAD